MAAKHRFRAEQVIAAIRGSGAIKSVIAQRLGCHRHTVDKYIREFPSVAQAYEDELETVCDIAETIIIQNLRLQLQQQQQGQVADSTDARWYLDRKGRTRGYVSNLDVTVIDRVVIEGEEEWNSGRSKTEP